jgi:hypothetical protein
MASILLTHEQLTQLAAASMISGIIMGDAMCKETITDTIKMVNDRHGDVNDALKNKLLIEVLLGFATKDPMELVDFFLEEGKDKLNIPFNSEDLHSFARETVPGVFAVDPDMDFVREWTKAIKAARG